MADLSSLLRYAPVTAGGMIGQQQAQDSQTQSLNQQHMQQLLEGMKQEQAQNVLMNPLRVQEAQQTLRKSTLGNDLSQGTQDSTIGATNAKNSLQISTDNAQQARQAANMFSSWAGILDATPDEPGARVSRLMSLLQAAKMDPSSPQVAPLLQTFSKTPSSQLPKTLRAIGDDLVHHSAPYMQAIDVEDRKAAASKYDADTRASAGIKEANIRASGQLENTKLQIEAGRWSKQDKNTIESRISAAPNAKAKAEVLETAYAASLQKGDSIAAQDYLKRATEARQRAIEDAGAAAGAGQAGKPAIGPMTGLPTNPNLTATAPIGGVNPSGALVPPGQAQAIPPGAIQMLRSNPNLRGAFDAKYGSGASAKVLGQ